MANLGFTACSLSVFLSAVAGHAPCARGVLIEKDLLLSNQLDVFGRSHTALGAADLSLSPTGALVVSNIGSSGLDGVTFRLGDVRGHSMSLDMGDMSALAPGAVVELFHPYSWGGQTVFVAEQNGGSAVMGIDGTGPGRRCVTVTVLDNGSPVARIDRIWDSRSEIWDSRSELVAGDLGSDPISGQGVSISFEQIEWDYVTTMTLPADTQLALLGDPGAPAGPVAMGDQVRVVVHGLPPGEAPSGDIRVTASDLGRDLVISSEDLVLPGISCLQLPGVEDACYGLSVGPRVTALGSAHVEGLDEAAACQSHAKVWFASTRLLDTTRALQVDNLGSSGQDGVRISYGGGTPCGVGFTQCPDGSCVVDPADCTAVATDRVVYIGGKDRVIPDYLDADDDGDSLRLGATGSSGGLSGVDFGNVTLTNAAGGGNELELHADFSSIGSDLVSVAVYSGGAFVGEFQQLVQPGVSIATILPSPDGIDLDSCGKFVGGPPFGPPCFFFTTAAEFTLFGGGQLLAGDECRVLAAGNPTPIDYIATFDITGVNLEPFDFRTDSDADDWGVTGRGTVAQGTRMHAVGGATVSTDASDGLVVDNIGSSGQDGVAIDLGDTEASSMTFGGGNTFSFDTTMFITNAAYEPGCVACPPEEIMTVGMLGVSADHVQISATSPDPAAVFTVTPRDRFGHALGSFVMDQPQSLSVIDPTGVGVELGRVDQLLSDPEGGPYLCGTTTHFIVAGGGGGGGGGSGGMEVLSPTGVLYQDVRSVQALMSNPTLSACCRGHVTVLKRGDTGDGTRSSAEAMLLPALMKAKEKANRTRAASRGQARTNIEVCDSSTGTDSFLTVANIGSSGQDGVSFDLSPDTCRASADCCIDDDCDGPVDDVWANVKMLDGNGDDEIKVKFVVKKAPAAGGGGGGSISYVGTCDADGATGSTAIGLSIADDLGAAYAFGAEVTLFDQSGFELAVFGFTPQEVSSSNMLVIVGGGLDGHYEWSMLRELDPAEGRLRQRPEMFVYEWATPFVVSLPLHGVLIQSVARCEIRILPQPGSSLYFDEAESFDVLAAAPAGEPGSFEVSDSDVTRLAPPCQADVNNDGFLDNGDIVTFITLFLQQSPAVDFNADGVIDNGDISGFIAAFLAGCP